MMNSIETLTTSVMDADITYYRCGEGGRTIVLVHGAGADSALLSWSEVMVLLAQKGYMVIAPDLPGYGASDDIDQVYSLPFYSEFIRSFVKGLGLGRIVLSGLSLGGGITLKVALDEPELLEAIIPVDAWGLSDRLPLHRFTHWYVNSIWNEKIYPWTGKYRWMIRWSLESNLFGDKSKVTDELVDKVVIAMQKPNAGEPFRIFQKAEITPTSIVTRLYEHMPSITLPTLLIHGSNDSAVPLKDAVEAQKQFPNAQLYIMEGCKHWPQKERPEEYANEVNRFMMSL